MDAHLLSLGQPARAAAAPMMQASCALEAFQAACLHQKDYLLHLLHSVRAQSRQQRQPALPCCS